MIKLYHAPQSRSVRVRWLLEELGDVPYELAPVTFESMKKPEYLRVHPLGAVPAIQDGDVTMFESGAILSYLLERYGRGRLAPAPATSARAPYLQWFFFGEATMAPPLVDVLLHSMFLPEPQRVPAVAESGRKRFAQLLDVLEPRLAGKQYLCGEFTAADIMVGYAVGLGRFVGLGTDGPPNVQEYFGRLGERPAFQRAMA
jgi:glutathione S-transferase